METNQNQKHGAAAIKGTWWQDFLASIVVFLVALPLCMGIAIASGAPASTGLLAGIIGGILVGVLSGCPIQVSGPAAGLATVMYDAIQRHGLEQLGLMVFIAGLFQLVGGFFRIGKWFRAVSPAVIQGMLGGIGVLIFAGQFHVMLDDVPKGNGLQNLMTIPQAIQKAAHLPTHPERDLRQDLRMVLQDLGELHRRQVSLNEVVSEHVPHHKNRPTAQFKPMLEQFVPQQAEIKAELQSIIDRSAELFRDQPQRRRKVVDYGKQALTAQDLCLADLKQEQYAFIMSAQEDAAAKLTNFQVVFKNHEFAAGVGILTILMLVFWKASARGSLKMVPAPLIAVAVGTLVAAFWQLPILYVEVPASIWNEIHFLTPTVLRDVEWTGILGTATTIAVLATAQTLLTATAVDHMHHGGRSDYDKELVAQGVGNCLCGFVGALPLAAVIVRSTANIEAGGQSRLSTILHGIWMLLIVSFLGIWLRMIPTSVLAAILVYTGYQLVNWRSVRKFLKYGKGEFLVYLLTLGIVVSVDLLTGVVAGFVSSLALVAYRASRLRVQQSGPDLNGDYQLMLGGAATFLKLPKLVAALENLPGKSIVKLNVEGLTSIDQACLEALQSWTSQHESGGGEVLVEWSVLEAWAREGRRSIQPTPAVHRQRRVKRKMTEV